MQLEQDMPLSCLLRVYLHGPLEVVKREASGNWRPIAKGAWGKGKPARSIFKHLLATPGRRLSRGKLQEDIWPDMEDFELADKYLYNAINQIRRVTGKPLVRTIETIYEIADQSQVWVDIDACESLLKAAEDQGHTSNQALPLLEQALRYLERGEFLEGESGTWIYGFRKKSEDLLRQCRLWLAESYEVHGKPLQAGLQYRALLQTVPLDEDALCVWLEMLHRHGKSQEALKCYQDIKHFVEAQGFTLSNTVEQWVASLDKPPLRTPVLHSPLVQSIFLPTQGTTISATTQEDSRMRILLRRHILLGILAIPFSLIQESAVTDAEAYLTQCQEQISSCWRLLHGKEISAVQFLLCSWLPPLEQLLSRSFPRWRKAAHLAAQGYILTGLVAILQRQNDAAEWCRRQAVEYAELSGDINLKIAALKHLATHYDDLRCFLVTRSIYEEALPLIAEATPLLRSRIELGLALAESRLGQQQKALHYWNLAQEHFPTYPEEDDPAFAYADCGKASFNHYGGLMYLEFGQAEQAWKLFNEVTTLPTPIPQRTTNEIVLCKAQTTLALRDLERTVNHLREGIQGAIELKSEMRLHDSLKLYQRACMLWPSERVLRELEDLFH